ncbi:MAG: hypothetical protein C0513_03065 [Isosphaera sp.]|nr:hypothetical protein [Isosphaera sp.]
MAHCPICDELEHCRAGTHPRLIARLGASYAVLHTQQGPRGWCVLWLDRHADHLDELDAGAQGRLFGDVALVARAQRAVFAGAGGAPPRINYACLGNQVAHVHWHLVPRHADDPMPAVPVWSWPAALLEGPADARGQASLIAQLRAAVRRAQ